MLDFTTSNATGCDMTKPKSITLSEHQSRAGRAGRGDRKKRGDSQYYKDLREKVGKNKTLQVPDIEW